MTDVLGPCPICGSGLLGEMNHSWDVPQTACGGCGFKCATAHWSLLRRKMTREEASTLLGTVVDAALEQGSDGIDEDGTSHEFDAAWAVAVRALTGEKT